MPETSTDRIGNYELLEAIGEGAEGRVYKARLAGAGATGELVALKRLRSTGQDKETLLFKRQTEILSKLDHPNIVRYKDSFIWREDELGEEAFCLVTELLEGESVKALLESHPKGLPWAQASGIMFQALSALQYASKLRVVHRDLKLSNLYITRQGSIKIIDFGIARHQDSSATTTSASANIKGSFDYMSPDFVHQEGHFRGDEQSDVFSFGVCLYQVLTGNLPFPSFSGNPLIGYVSRWHAPKPPEPDFRHPVFSVLSNAGSCIRKCLAVDRAARYRSFNEVMADFSNIKPRTLRHGNEVYEYAEYLGKGGFGRVFRARRLRDGFDTAIKEMLADRNASRFVREAKILQNARHPNLVQYLDFVEVEEQRMGDQRRLFLVLEYLKGMPAWGLRDRIRSSESGMDPQEVLTLFAGYLDCLDHMHQRGIIHRDIKPGNLYAPEGNPANGKIFDLGIAHDSEGTKTHGQVPGTLDFMPPEFALQSGDRGSAQSDIYSIGVTLYQALTKKLPYPRLPEKESDAWLAFYQRSERPPDCSFEHQVFKAHPELVRFVRRSLATDPKQRHASAGAMRDEILGILDVWEKKAAFDAAIAAAREAMGQDDYEEAERQALRAVDLVPDDATAAALLTQVRENLRNRAFADALEAVRTALAQADYPEAERRAQEALRLKPGDREVSQLLAQARDAARKLEASVDEGETSTAFLSKDEVPSEDATAATLPADLESIKREIERAEAQQREQEENRRREQEALAQAEQAKAGQAKREQAEQEKLRRSKLDQADKERLERVRREQGEKAKLEQAKREQAEKEELEQARQLEAEKEKQHQVRREQTEKEKLERAKRAQAESEQLEQARRLQAEKLEQARRVQEAKEQLERTKRDKEAKEAREQAQREQAEREALERQRREEAEVEKQRLAEERRAAREARMAELKPRIAKAVKLAAVVAVILGLAVGGYFGWQSYQNSQKVKRETSYQAAVQAGQTEFDNAQWETALARANEALRFKPGDEKAFKLKEAATAKLGEAKSAQEKEEKYQAAVKEAFAAIDAKDWGKAVAKADEALALKPKDSKAEQLKQAAQKGFNEAKSAQDREQTYQVALKAARDAFGKQDYATTSTRAAEALALKPNDPEATKLRDDAQRQLTQEQKYQTAVKAARDAFGKRDYVTTSTRAGEALALKPNDSEATKLRDDAQRQLTQEQKYQTAVKAARDAFGKRDYATASTRAGEALESRPDDPEARKLRDDAQKQLGSEQKYQTTFKAAQDALAKKDYATARTQAEAALALKANDPAALQVRKQAIEVPDLAKAKDLFDGGDLPGAKNVIQQHSGSDFFKTLDAEIQSEQLALTRAQDKFKAGDYSFLEDLKQQPYAKKASFASLTADGQRELQMLQSFESVKATNGWVALQTLLASSNAASVRDKSPFKALREWADGEARKVVDQRRQALAQWDAMLEKLLDSFNASVPASLRTAGGRKAKQLGIIGENGKGFYLGEVAKLQKAYTDSGSLEENGRASAIKVLRAAINNWE